jgi:hypothetical protein
LLLRVAGQIVPFDLFTFIDPRRDDFLRGAIRPSFYFAAVVLGAPLFAYGLWRWVRSPSTVPVFGVWWWCVIAAFTVARIPGHPAYVLALTPLPALLAAGAFDPIDRPFMKLLTAWRVAYVVAVCGITLTTVRWLADRGGAAGDYGVAYNRRLAQAASIAARFDHRAQAPFVNLGELPADADRSALRCAPAMFEVRWLVHRLGGRNSDAELPVSLCDAWIDERGRLVYRWTIGE